MKKKLYLNTSSILKHKTKMISKLPNMNATNWVCVCVYIYYLLMNCLMIYIYYFLSWSI